MNTENVIILARSNHGEHQVEHLQDYALRKGFAVVGVVGLPHTSANDQQVEETLTGLIARGTEHTREATVLVTDLSRLSRDTCRGLALLSRLAAAGWKVVVADAVDHGAGDITADDPNITAMR